MWMVDFFYAVEREHRIQDELERRRRLADAVRGDFERRRLRRLVERVRLTLVEAGDAVASFLERPVVGQHHV